MIVQLYTTSQNDVFHHSNLCVFQQSFSTNVYNVEKLTIVNNYFR